MDAAKKDVTLRKRQLIQDSARTMFIWVAGASVLVGFAVVTSWFLFERIVYKEKVLSAKAETVRTLKANNETAPKLTSNIRLLETNEALNNAKADQSKTALQVVLDALPAENNPLALGASMQQVLIGKAENISLESFSLNSSTSGSKIKSPVAAAKPVSFTAVISSSDPSSIKEVLRRLELSIRTINVDSLKLEQSATRMTATIQGHAYYVPAKSINLTEKTVPVK